MAGYRAIESGLGPQWNSKLLKELAFIKKNLRYPYGKVLPVSMIMLVVILCVVGFKLATNYVVDYTLVLAIIAVIAVIVLIPAMQYIIALKFKAVEARNTVAENTILLSSFFAAHHLVAFTHPEMEGIFQIQSGPLTFRKGATREVMTFIADDGRILINAHYSDLNFGHSAAVRNMELRLREWINRSPAVTVINI